MRYEASPAARRSFEAKGDANPRESVKSAKGLLLAARDPRDLSNTAGVSYDWSDDFPNFAVGVPVFIIPPGGYGGLAFDVVEVVWVGYDEECVGCEACCCVEACAFHDV